MQHVDKDAAADEDDYKLMVAIVNFACDPIMLKRLSTKVCNSKQ